MIWQIRPQAPERVYCGLCILKKESIKKPYLFLNPVDFPNTSIV